MKLYCWKFLEWSDEFGQDLSQGLQFAACDASRFAREVQAISPHGRGKWKLSRLPDGSPHHLDNASEVIRDRVTCFELLQIDRPESGEEIEITICGSTVTITVPTSQAAGFTEAVMESHSMGYLADNSVDVVFRTDGAMPQRIPLYLWSTDEADVIYY